MQYPSTENLYARDEETHKLILGKFKRPDFGQVDRWLVTEKIDGTNIRLVLDWTTDDTPLYEVLGRSDAATLPKRFVDEAVPHFGTARMVAAWRAIDPGEISTRMIVYGEGYGPGIQKCGVLYAPEKSLRIFDVITFTDSARGLWRTFEDVQTVAEVLGLKTVPVIYSGATTEEIVECVRGGLYSAVQAEEGPEGADVLCPMEGVVCRTDPYLYDFRGNRVLWKLKGHDLPQLPDRAEFPENFE